MAEEGPAAAGDKVALKSSLQAAPCLLRFVKEREYEDKNPRMAAVLAILDANSFFQKNKFALRIRKIR